MAECVSVQDLFPSSGALLRIYISSLTSIDTGDVDTYRRPPSVPPFRKRPLIRRARRREGLPNSKRRLVSTESRFAAAD